MDTQTIEISEQVRVSEIHRQLPSPLRLRRIVAGYTQQELARAAGRSRQQLSKIETGVCSPRIDTLEAFARVLGCDVADVLPVNGESPARRAEDSQTSATRHATP